MNSGLCRVEIPSLRNTRAISKHAIEAAHDEALQVQLRRDAEIEVDVEGVVVRDERAGGRATRDRVEHRRLDLDEAALGEELAQGTDDGEPDLEHAAGVVVRDQVDVALAVAGVDVGESVPLVRELPLRLGEHRERLDPYGELAALRLHHRALGADPVPAGDLVAEAAELLAPDVALTDEQLAFARAVTQRHEDQLALGPHGHGPARDPHDVVRRVARDQTLVVVGAELPERVRPVEAVREAGFVAQRVLTGSVRR